DVMGLNGCLGYDFNPVEMAVRDGIPYAFDFYNPAPEADRNSVGGDRFAWGVEHAADMVIRGAQAPGEGGDNPRWGRNVQKTEWPTWAVSGTPPWGPWARSLRPFHPRSRPTMSDGDAKLFTLGIEEEFQLIDPETRDLRSLVQYLLDDDHTLADQLKPELHQS